MEEWKNKPARKEIVDFLRAYKLQAPITAPAP